MQKRTVSCFVLILIILLSACGAAQEVPTATPRPLIPITVQLSWLHTIEFAGFYMGVDKGLYAGEGLDVVLNSGGFDAEHNFIDPIAQVTSGAADYGVIDAGSLLLARAAGTPVVAIATIYQRSPFALVSLAEKGINTPAALAGTTVAIDPITSDTIYQALLSAENIDPASVNLTDRTDFTIAPITDGVVDVLDGWVTNEVVSLLQAGYEVNTILASDYGIDLYANVIFTTEDKIASETNQVQAFVRATLLGTQVAIDDPENAAELAVARNADLDLANQTQAMQSSLPLLNPANSQPGQMKADDWEFTYNTLREQNILTSELDLSAVYTTRFVDGVYAAGAGG